MAKTTVPIELSSTPSIVDNGNATAITIDSSENVGIGTNSPAQLLHVVGSGSTPFATQRNVNSGGFAMIQGKMGDSASTSAGHVYSALVAGIEDNTNGAEDGYFALEVSEGGLGSEKLRVTSSGNVGIGTSSPAVKTHIAASSYTAPTGGLDPNIKLLINNTQYCGMQILGSSTGSSFIHFGDQDNADVGLITYEHNGDYMRFDVNASERMRIDSSGNLLVGTTSAVTGNSLATVATGITASSSTSPALQLYCSGAGSNQKYWRWTSKTTGDIRLEQVNDAYTSPTQRLRIDSSGYLYNPSMLGSASANSDVRFNTSDGLIYYQTSSRRYKENIQDLPSMLDKVNALRAVTFDEIATGESCYGLIAEEVFEQIPELVNLKEVEGYDTPQPDNIPYSMLSVFLLKAIQEQQTIIEDLKARITTLEGN
jgi:hypothetical protein